MVDNLKPEDRKKTMQAVKGKETKLEIQLCSMLAGMGLKGWEKNANNVIGKPDIIFIDDKLAIFIDGCFWHGCPICKRKLPQTNREYWERKINHNIELAKRYNQRLVDDGWTVLRIWEHEMVSKLQKLELKIRIHHTLQRKRQIMSLEAIKQESIEILNEWIKSCTRQGGKISRNTIAIGIVVLDHLRRSCSISRDDVISPGGEIKGARSGLGNALAAYGIPRLYLKEVTTRQGHQDGQRLFKQLGWGNKLTQLTELQREQVLQELANILVKEAKNWLNRQNLKLDT